MSQSTQTDWTYNSDGVCTVACQTDLEDEGNKTPNITKVPILDIPYTKSSIFDTIFSFIPDKNDSEDIHESCEDIYDDSPKATTSSSSPEPPTQELFLRRGETFRARRSARRRHLRAIMNKKLVDLASTLGLDRTHCSQASICTLARVEIGRLTKHDKMLCRQKNRELKKANRLRRLLNTYRQII